MALTKRNVKGSAITATEHDANLDHVMARANHTGTQAASTVTGLATVATSGAYGDLTGRPTLGTAAAAASTDFATAEQGTKADNAVQPADLISADANNTLVAGVKFWSGTQAQYDAIATKDSNTIYVVEG